MALLNDFLKSQLSEMMENGIRLNALGQIERLPEDVQDTLKETMDKTRENQGMLLNLALSYGSRDEIVDAVRKIASDVSAKRLRPEEITPDLFEKYLYTSGIPDPDLLIRTSGEMRISNFLLWQIAYTEIYITSTLWPDFGKEEFMQILMDYQRRERRFGMTSEQIKSRQS